MAGDGLLNGNEEPANNQQLHQIRTVKRSITEADAAEPATPWFVRQAHLMILLLIATSRPLSSLSCEQVIRCYSAPPMGKQRSSPLSSLRGGITSSG